MLQPMTPEETERRERTKPRSFDLSNPDELDRLLRETLGYARVSLHKKDGTDLAGREWAYIALRNALDHGYRLVPPSGPTIGDLADGAA